MTNIARYSQGHLFDMYSDKRTALVESIASKLGGVTAEDLANFDLFCKRMRRLSKFARERNCLLYVDAEQTYI